MKVRHAVQVAGDGAARGVRVAGVGPTRQQTAHQADAGLRRSCVPSGGEAGTAVGGSVLGLTRPFVAARMVVAQADVDEIGRLLVIPLNV